MIAFQIGLSRFAPVSGEDPISGQAIQKMGATTDGGAVRLARCWAHSVVLRKTLMKTIVCAVDDSPGAAEALVVAAGMSKDLGLRLVLAHVGNGHRRSNGVGVAGVQTHEGAERLLERIARKHSLEFAADRRAEVGDPASELSRIAGEEAAAVIVLGSRRRYWRRRNLVSGLSTALRNTAPCPVLIVPPSPRR